ncbi:hypothetical protein H6G89_21515 [Oscillatoria sp. FACHB-1407]|uniref:hypothetical protein n=1 Tax=Oscillatoria sp. FACHB-1407 TaxID=2692847 RepID=UPI0016828B1A|nr:hypothetical protein [Oscillatoria sp. FACHB-1407]MBD2463584.1 hypothetical protein [Oscillatoria sp. FACHB-1407]
MNSRLSRQSPPTRTPEDAGFYEPMQVGFAPIAADLSQNPDPEFTLHQFELASLHMIP